MKRIRQYTYVERELIRQRVERNYRAVEKVKKFLAVLALVVCTEVFMFALVLMS